MKKIAILTFQFPENMNFGASLQSFAVQNLFEDSLLINYNCLKTPSFIQTLKNNIIFKVGGRGFVDYNNKFLKTTKECETFKELKELNKEFDTFIVGSDQVWRTVWLKEKSLRYFFDFVDDNKTKIAYAASFGVDFWEGNKELTEKIKPLVKKFDYVSVREESGIKICKDIFEIDAVCVLDPTMMIDRKKYQVILDDWKDKSHKNKKYIAHIVLDDTPELRDESNNIGKYLNSDINYIKGRNIKILGKNLVLYNKVSQWLTYVKDAELVITDSFHCTVFSILFNKKFVVVANKVRGIARLETLLKMLGLEDRLFVDIKDVLKSGILDKTIDYEEVEKKLDEHRKYSMEFLKKALGDDNE